jgi:preprotein translocase subunit SecA
VEYQREGYDMFIGMLDGLKEESVGFLFNVQVEATAQAPTVAAQPMPEGLREGIQAKGIDDEASRQLTYVGPSEDGNAEIQQHDAPEPGAVSRKDRRQAKRLESKSRKLLRRG